MKMEVDKVSADVIYSSFLKNEDASENLLNLVNQAEDFNSKKSDYDVIKEYLQSSRNCQELLEFIKNWSNSDLKDAVSLMKVLCHILIRVASDLNIYAPAGTSLVNEILAHGMKTVFNFLQFKQKSSRTKLALHLLASMVALGKITAFKVVSKLNFSHANFFHLLNKRNFSEEEDARTAFLNFIVLILSKCDNNVIRQIVEIKGFLNSIIPGLISDRPETIILVLKAFRRHIVENQNISKNFKLRLFNDHSLKPIIQLYIWKGPLRNKQNRKRKLGDDDNPVAFEVSDEEASEVHKTVHEFMLALCCSHETGIINKDPSFGMSGKNMNPVVSNILKECLKPYVNANMSEFVLSVLKACPDQLKFYISLIKDNFMPRLSQSWLDVGNFLKKLLLSQDPIAVLFHSESKHSVSALLDIGSTVCLLDIVSSTVIQNTFLNGHHILSYYLCDFLLCILNQVRSILYFSGDQKSMRIYESSDIEKFQKSFRSLLSMTLPVSEGLHMYLKELTKITKEHDIELSSNDVAIPSLAEELLLLFKLMKAFNEISPEDFAINWPAIFSSLKKLDINLTNEELSSVYAYVIDILADDEYPIFGNLNISESLLIIVGDILVSSLKSNSPKGFDILYKIFLQTMVFDDCKWEASIWQVSIKSLKSKQIQTVLKFINMSFHSLFTDPGKFSGLSSSSYAKQNGESSKNSEQLLTQTEYKVSTNQGQCYSDFLLAALEQLKSLSKEEKKSCQLFVEEALVHIMHHQYDLTPLYSAIRPYKSLLSSSVVEYFEILLSKSRPESLVMRNACSTKCTLDLVGHLKQNFLYNLSSDTDMETCSCDVSALLENLDNTSIGKVVCQVLTYLNFEVTMAMGKRDEETTALGYINLLEQFINCISTDGDSLSLKYDATSASKDFELSPYVQKLEILKEVLDHPIILKLFLGMPSESFKHLQNCSLNATKLVYNIVKKVIAMNDTSLLYLLYPYKDKIMEALLGKSYTDTEELDLNALVVTFSGLFDAENVRTSLEKMVCASSDHGKSSVESLKSLFMLMGIYFQSKETLPLSPNLVNFLITKYVSASKKQKKGFRKSLMELFEKYPVTALFLNEDSSQLFIQNRTTKDLPILKILINSNNVFRKAVQNYMMETPEIDSVEFIYLTSNCLNRCNNEEEADDTYKSNISSRLWKTLNTFLLDETEVEEEALKESGAGLATQMLILGNYISFKKLYKFSKMLLEHSQNVLHSHFKIRIILQLLESWRHHEGEKSKEITLSLKISLRWLASLLSTDYCFWELTNFLQDVLKDANDLLLDELIDVNDFFIKMLKISFKNETIGKEIFKILCLLSEKCRPESLPVDNIYNLVSGHSKFFQIMVSENSEQNILKECLIDLLTILIQLDGTLCKETHIGLYLSSYGGTMSSVDQKILYLIKLYADNNIDMTRYRPFLWGKQAVTHYSIMNDSKLYLWKQPKLQDVLSAFIIENIESTVLNFPLKATLLPSRQVIELEEKLSDKIYDFRYYLPQLATLLSPGSFVHCNSVLESKILMLVFVSLSSFDSNTRAVGYYCLSQFYHHLESANFKEKDIWICLLDSLRNSIITPNPRLPSIISIFLARVVDIFTRPDHFMYVPLYKFITAKPCLDITQVPEYYKLFNSIEIDHRAQRLWLLSFVSDGLQTSLDFHICQKRYIFRDMMTDYFCCMSTEPEKVQILKAIQNAVKISSTARIMCQNGLLVWLSNVIGESDCCTKSEITNSLCSIMDNLITTAKSSFEDSNTAFDISCEFTVVIFSLLKKLSFPDFLTVKKCISALSKALTAASSGDNIMPQLSKYHVLLLLKIWKHTVKTINEDENCLNLDQDTKKCFQSFAKIITHWYPVMISENNIAFDKISNCICDILELVSLSFDNSALYLYDFPQWLHKYLEKLSKPRLEQFLSTRDCFKLILKIYEKTLQWSVINNELKGFSSVNQTNSWNNLLHCFKELSHPEFVWFKHIADAVSS